MKLEILRYGDPVLRAKGDRIGEVDDRVRQLAADMIDTMHAASGVGLAAQQVGEPLQLAVIDVCHVEDRPSTLKRGGVEVDLATVMPMILINPQITLGSGSEVGNEGCLSFPEITGDIERARIISVRAENLEGDMVEFEASGLLARAIQHEIDHINGILFIDRMNSAAKVALASRLKRMQKDTLRALRQEKQPVATRM
jgi:peptide deformylase